MALIYTDSNREDIDYVQKHWNIDFDIGLYNGSDNDFEITVPSEEWTDRFNDYSIVYDEDGKPRIHTDGTGFISEDLAMKCPGNIYKGHCSIPGDIQVCNFIYYF